MTARHWVFAAAAVLFLWWLGGHDLWAPDEPYFAEGAREMVVDGRWAVPHVNGVVTTDKPPLFFWLIALFSLPFGEVNSWTARLPSALAALGTVALTMRLGRHYFGPRTAALAGVALATTYLFWEKARWSQTDSVLCFLIWVALAAFAEFRSGDLDGRRAGLVFWLAAALAVLDKGPVGFLLPLGIALSVLITDRDLRSWRRFAPFSGPLLFALVLAAWVLFSIFGDDSGYSVWGALREHFVDRGIHGMHHKQPPWYFLEVLPPVLMPWTALLPGALLLAWRRRLPFDRFLLVAALFVVAFFSISTEKRELYALPAVPALALMTAALVGKLAGWREPALDVTPQPSHRWVTVAQTVLGSLLVLVGLVMPLAAERAEELRPWMPWAFSVLFLAAGGTTLFLARKRRILPAALTPAVGLALAYLLVATAVYPLFEPRKSARPFALRIQEVTAESRAAGLPVVAYELGNLPEPFAYYTNGMYTLETDDAQVLRRHLEREERVFAVVDGDRLEPLPEALRDRLGVIDSTRLSRRRVLLVTNGEHPEAKPLATVGPDE
ncbi:MAG: ArnT family glycosyltransferase [Thermoanaerobaculia bacterium]